MLEACGLEYFLEACGLESIFALEACGLESHFEDPGLHQPPARKSPKNHRMIRECGHAWETHVKSPHPSARYIYANHSQYRQHEHVVKIRLNLSSLTSWTTLDHNSSHSNQSPCAASHLSTLHGTCTQMTDISINLEHVQTSTHALKAHAECMDANHFKLCKT